MRRRARASAIYTYKLINNVYMYLKACCENLILFNTRYRVSNGESVRCLYVQVCVRALVHPCLNVSCTCYLIVSMYIVVNNTLKRRNWTSLIFRDVFFLLLLRNVCTRDTIFFFFFFLINLFLDLMNNARHRDYYSLCLELILLKISAWHALLFL